MRKNKKKTMEDINNLVKAWVLDVSTEFKLSNEDAISVLYDALNSEVWFTIIENLEWITRDNFK
jgi:hypothetical protein